MCSCDTSSGRTVSAQRQAAFSSCSRGAMALTEKVLAVPGGRRRRLRLRTNGHRHLPAERPKRSPQLADQSITCARHSRRARPRPACTTKPQSAAADTRQAPRLRTLAVRPAAACASVLPAVPAPKAPVIRLAEESKATAQRQLATSFPPWPRQLRFCPCPLLGQAGACPCFPMLPL